MSLVVKSILRAALRHEDEPLNIISISPSENFLHNLSQTGHNFYTIGKRWDHTKVLLPENVKEAFNIESNNFYDLVLCSGRNRQFHEAKSLSRKLHIPLVLLELDFPNPNRELDKMNGDINVFLSDNQALAWGYKKDYILINNCVDTNLFALQSTDRKNQILTAIPNWKERDWSHGFRLYHRYFNKKQAKILGQERFVHWQDLIEEYNKSKVYFNPTIFSVQPNQILEAMACGCLVVAFDSDFNREIIEDKKNGFLCQPEKTQEILDEVLSLNETFSIQQSALETLSEKFSLEKFLARWKETLSLAAKIPFTGK